MRMLLPFLFILSACASAPMEYDHFAIDTVNDKLLAHDPKDDMILSKACAPAPTMRVPCLAMRTDDFYNMLNELRNLRDQVITLQRGPAPK